MVNSTLMTLVCHTANIVMISSTLMTLMCLTANCVMMNSILMIPVCYTANSMINSTLKKRPKMCYTANSVMISVFSTEDATKTLVTSYILSRLDYCNCLLIGTPNSVIQPLQNLKFRTLLQDLFSWHPVTTTQHLSWKNCTGFPFQNVSHFRTY